MQLLLEVGLTTSPEQDKQLVPLKILDGPSLMQSLRSIGSWKDLWHRHHRETLAKMESWWLMMRVIESPMIPGAALVVPTGGLTVPLDLVVTASTWVATHQDEAAKARPAMRTWSMVSCSKQQRL